MTWEISVSCECALFMSIQVSCSNPKTLGVINTFISGYHAPLDIYYRILLFVHGEKVLRLQVFSFIP